MLSLQPLKLLLFIVSTSSLLHSHSSVCDASKDASPWLHQVQVPRWHEFQDPFSESKMAALRNLVLLATAVLCTALLVEASHALGKQNPESGSEAVTRKKRQLFYFYPVAPVVPDYSYGMMPYYPPRYRNRSPFLGPPTHLSCLGTCQDDEECMVGGIPSKVQAEERGSPFQCNCEDGKCMLKIGMPGHHGGEGGAKSGGATTGAPAAAAATTAAPT